MALNLVIPSIVCRKFPYMDKATDQLRRYGQLPDPSLLRYVSLPGREQIVLAGNHDWNPLAAERTNVRPRNLPPAKIRARIPTQIAPLTQFRVQTFR